MLVTTISHTNVFLRIQADRKLTSATHMGTESASCEQLFKLSNGFQRARHKFECAKHRTVQPFAQMYASSSWKNVYNVLTICIINFLPQLSATELQ